MANNFMFRCYCSSIKMNDESLKINEYVPFLMGVVKPPPSRFSMKATGKPPFALRMVDVGKTGLSNNGAKTFSAEYDKLPVASKYSTLCTSSELIVFHYHFYQQ